MDSYARGRQPEEYDSQRAKMCSRENSILAVLLTLAACLSSWHSQVRAQTGNSKSQVPSAGEGVQILTDTQGVDFGPYLQNLTNAIRKQWLANIPESARMGQKGKVSIRFGVEKDGTLSSVGPTVETESGQKDLEAAALRAITQAAPFPPLPIAFRGRFIRLRLLFAYNLPPEEQTFIPPSWSQAVVTDKTGDSATPRTLPPYDRLELLASIAVSGSDSYLTGEVRERGIDFAADQPFLDAILRWHAHTDLIGLVENAKPVTRHTPSPNRQRAYALLVPLSTRMRDPTATEVFQSAVALAPESPALHLALAAHLFWIPHRAGAELEARKSIELWPDNADAHYVLALILIAEDRSDEGIVEARQALTIYPQHKAAVAELGMALWRDRQFKEAIPVLQQAISQNSGMPFLHKYLGTSLFNTGDIQGAISEYMAFLQASPNDADGHYQLGVAFRAQGHTDDALAQFRECARLDPSSSLCTAAADPSSASRTPTPPAGTNPDDGSVDRNIYTNRFFGFSFRFPEDWTSLGPDAARAATKLGAGMMSGGDPTIQDAQQAGAAHAYPLLFVVPPRDRGISSRAIQIQALDRQITGPDSVSGKEFLEAAARLYRQMHTPLQPTGPPTEVSVDDRKLWRLDMTMTVDNNVHYLSEIVTIQDGFVLLFAFASPDQSGRDDLLQCMNSLQFFPKSK